MSTALREPLDVWLRFDSDEDEEAEAEAEANTFESGDEFVVEWYLNAVGLVKRKWFTTYQGATDWLIAQGFEDYTS